MTADPMPERRAPEAVLGDDPSTDLTSKVVSAWRDFHAALTGELPTLVAASPLELRFDADGAGRTPYTVRIGRAVLGQVTASAVGNADLPAEQRLNRAALGQLAALGWTPPGVVAGSGTSFGLTLSTAELPRLATIVTRTLSDVFGAPHPAFLTFAVAAGTPVPALSSARPDPNPVDAQPAQGAEPAKGAEPAQIGSAPAGADLTEQVRDVVARLLRTPVDQLAVDADGDIGVRAGSAMVFVRIQQRPPLIDVRSPVLTGVQPSQRLFARLSELTDKMPVGRLYCANDTVWASVPVMGRDFQPSHLTLAVSVMTDLADQIDDHLQKEFGGRRFYGDSATTPPTGDPQIGMYL